LPDLRLLVKRADRQPQHRGLRDAPVHTPVNTVPLLPEVASFDQPREIVLSDPGTACAAGRSADAVARKRLQDFAAECARDITQSSARSG
jgi:hypothetical protein